MEYLKERSLSAPREEVVTPASDPDPYGDDVDLDISHSLVWTDEKVPLHATMQVQRDFSRGPWSSRYHAFIC